jgi:ubiquinone/menaquinone biosynthesis C-methylase UbiE
MGLWGRIFAATYDACGASGEKKGLGAERARLLADLHGRVLEIGAGTGANVEHYPPGVDAVYTEPDRYMAQRLARRDVDVVSAGADSLPFEDASFDFVVSTMVLCTVPDVPAALGEIRRVLKPEGKLVFLEHVRGEPGSKLERWQDRLQGPWRAVGRGCNCNRDLIGSLAAAGYDADYVRHEWKFIPPLVRPIVSGTAVPR